MKHKTFMKYNRFVFTVVRVAIFAAFILLVLRPSMKSFFKKDELQLAQTFEAGNPEKDIQADWTQLMSDYEKTRALDLFDPSKKTSNAYQHLKKTLGDKDGNLILLVPQSLKEELKDSSKKVNWKKNESLFAFLKGIEKFDYIQVPSVNENIVDPGYWDVAPIKGYLDIPQILELRLLHGLEFKEFDQAVKEVRHFLKLIVNLDNKLYPLIAATTLKKENDIRNKYKANRLTKIKSLTYEEIGSLRNFFLKEGQLSDIRLSDKAFQQGLEVKLGLCHRLIEASKVVVIGHEVLKGKSQSQIQRLKTALESTKDQCGENKITSMIINNKIPIFTNEQLLEMSKNISVDTADGQQQIDLKSLNKKPELREKLIYELMLLYIG